MSITWAELHARVLSLAAVFADRGVGRGDRVAILMTNRPEFVECVLAANAIGAIAVPINFRLTPDEVAYVLRRQRRRAHRHRRRPRPACRRGRGRTWAHDGADIRRRRATPSSRAVDGAATCRTSRSTSATSH